MKVIGFHAPTGEYGFLSNWYKADFTMHGVVFSSVEQYMMWSKAMYFGDKKHAQAILETDDVAEIKNLGRKVTNYSDYRWSGIRQLVVYDGLMAKFTQNKALTEKLAKTDDCILAECAVNDHIWGIGRSMTDPRRFNINEWDGDNLLGFALMRVQYAYLSMKQPGWKMS